MRIRLVGLVLCFAAMWYCGTTLLAQPTEEWVCCTENESCDVVGGKCCDNVSIGMPECDTQAAGYCMTACVRPSNNLQ